MKNTYSAIAQRAQAAWRLVGEADWENGKFGRPFAEGAGAENVTAPVVMFGRDIFPSVSSDHLSALQASSPPGTRYRRAAFLRRNLAPFSLNAL